MNYLFWNTNKNKVNNILKDIIIENKCDIIALAEYEDAILSLIASLDKANIHMYTLPSMGCNRIVILSKFKEKDINYHAHTSYYRILQVPHDNVKNHLIALVHLPSKLNANVSDIDGIICGLISELEKSENKLKTKNSIIAGDFNINPFESPMIAAKSAHALSSREITKRKKRIVYNNEYNMFYNPMWNLFGDNDGVPGTYYYSSSNQEVYFWNIFDQVIIRPDLIENFDNSSLKILTKTKVYNLLNKNNKPKKDISDHLPIFFKIN
ncbi:hypothetical protein AB8J26_001548 [Clostridium perfringens]